MIGINKAVAIAIFQFVIIAGCSQNNKSDKSSSDRAIASDTTLNRLANAKSPYLRQHADNPVDWYEWGEEALDKAKEENKPLLISIGYSACHWCHVMEHESFMDSSVAKIMNENFVSIKIDREERPDIDQIYMNAAQLISGRGGWPLNAFAMPDGRPFYAATYFPKKEWKEILTQLSNTYQNDFKKVDEQAELLTQGIRQQDMIKPALDSTSGFAESVYDNIYKNWKTIIDFKKGGFDRAPKFPLPVGWDFLLQYHYLTENEEALEAVIVTLDEMAKGGIYDQIGGGFARYSTDAEWFAPHFEKMLYDNGQLVSLYADAYKVTKNESYASIIRETLTFIEREMTSSEGGFYSSLNADSEGEEGKFYVWTQQEIHDVLNEETAKLISDYYQVKKSGNWEHRSNILHRKEGKRAFSEKHNRKVGEWDKMLSKAKEKLMDRRSERIRPSTDDKILTSWNALMLSGYVDAYLALGEKEYLKSALKNAQFLEDNMLREDGRLWRNYKDGEAGIEAFLDDYALLADAYIQLYQATFDIHWLNLAKTITDYAINNFKDDKSGMFYYTSDQSENLIARKMEIRDNVIPGSNSVMATVLYKLGEYFYNQFYINMSKTMLNQVSEDTSAGGPYYANWAKLMGLMAYEPYEIAIIGRQSVEKSLIMQNEFLPTALFMGGEKENLPLLENKLRKDNTIIYVCRNKTCKLPVKEVEKALGQMR
ncbi:thioredoxin domain-containing protein [Marivirga sp.]|uniref:thioredoxin domain-containing protein n=1 Tax=Marivirga sp. TaxID=2018662 RepID=UPI003DA6D355